MRSVAKTLSFPHEQLSALDAIVRRRADERGWIAESWADLVREAVRRFVEAEDAALVKKGRTRPNGKLAPAFRRRGRRASR